MGRGRKPPPPSFLCLSWESIRRASARREESFERKDLGWLDPCDEHRDEVGGRTTRSTPLNRWHRLDL
ncbi:MAG TPA: hypothetical protein DEB63_00160 [Agrobacterium sp.]|nr:hypothetical protein [Agrobacterium sp.]